ncbi:hypothetical protein CCR75_000002 [Bremia lactucae]|uniref:Uncharacterized protein n=1 Tax=Bremia lactucae TaxID=4779 RepID=A0A976FRM1_BRELC|nr:hypothetical protein CCR75_000002 [Bremia lactucae]
MWSRRSWMTTFDPLFVFDAPQTVVDLSVPLVSYPAGTHDPWFDRVHPQHSKPSAELARELADMVQKYKGKEQQSQRETARRERKSHYYMENSRFDQHSDKENQQPAALHELMTQLKQLKQLYERSETLPMKKKIKRLKTKKTYEPPQHSVRIVKQWERATKRSFYALTANERVLAITEIAIWKKQRKEKKM